MLSRKWSTFIRILQWRPSKSINFSTVIETMERYWANENENPKSLSQTISIISEKQMGEMFPNVMRVLEMLFVIPATSASVERSNSALRYLKICAGAVWVNFVWML